MIFHIHKDKIYLNGKTLKFDFGIKDIIFIKNVLIILIAPDYKNDKTWQDDWSSIKDGNVFVIDKQGNILWKWQKKGAHGISTMENFWIKSSKNYDSLTAFWISDTDKSFLVKTETGEILQEVDTHILK